MPDFFEIVQDAAATMICGGESFFKHFCCTKVHLVGPMIAQILDFMSPSPWVSKPGWFSHLQTSYLCMVNLWVMSGDSPTFSTNTLYKHVNSRLTFQTSIMPPVEGWQLWITNLGRNKIQFRTACLTTERAYHLTTPAGRLHLYDSNTSNFFILCKYKENKVLSQSKTKNPMSKYSYHCTNTLIPFKITCFETRTMQLLLPIITLGPQVVRLCGTTAYFCSSAESEITFLLCLYPKNNA